MWRWRWTHSAMLVSGIDEDIKEFMSMFIDINFDFVKRFANRSTHIIASEAVSMSDCEK